MSSAGLFWQQYEYGTSRPRGGDGPVCHEQIDPHRHSDRGRPCHPSTAKEGRDGRIQVVGATSSVNFSNGVM
jgi:hypothetical protein